jgi:5-oxoprolinase (ATP-hydrolysing)
VLKKKQTLEFYHKIIICGEWLMMMMMSSQIIVEPDCTAVITKFGNVHIKVGEGSGPSLAAQAKEASLKADVIQLSIFNNRFMGIAEQMGRTLQRTSISTNIKERLDFSCALFSPDGGLVANAPHVPVHLGAMSSTVRWQLAYWSVSLPLHEHHQICELGDI